VVHGKLSYKQYLKKCIFHKAYSYTCVNLYGEEKDYDFDFDPSKVILILNHFGGQNDFDFK